MIRTSILSLVILLFTQAAGAQIIDTVAGGGPNNVPALSANVETPQGVVVDSAGNLFIASTPLHHIFKVDTSGQLTLFAGNGFAGFSGDGGPATSANLRDPTSVALDSAGNLLRYCQELCMTFLSGGQFLDSVLEDDAVDDVSDQVRSIQCSPSLLRRHHQLEDHRQAGDAAA